MYAKECRQELRDELKAEKLGALDLIKNEEQNAWNRLNKEEAEAVLHLTSPLSLYTVVLLASI